MASSLQRRLLAIDGVVESPFDILGPLRIVGDGVEVAHQDAEGAYDVRLTRQVIRQVRDQLRAEPRVHLRASSSSDWVQVEVTGADGEELLLALVTAAAAAHRPPSGIALRQPPHGEELARRRRFH